jgi:hypothetical protein
MVPFMADRLEKAHYTKMKGLRWGRILKDLIRKRNAGLELAERVAYDTVGAANPVTHVALRQLLSPGQIRFGRNFPGESEETVEAAISFFFASRRDTPHGP